MNDGIAGQVLAGCWPYHRHDSCRNSMDLGSGRYEHRSASAADAVLAIALFRMESNRVYGCGALAAVRMVVRRQKNAASASNEHIGSCVRMGRPCNL